jgi:hypothetical protein
MTVLSSSKSCSHQKAYRTQQDYLISHLIASVFILQESKTAENIKIFSENDKAQAQKLNQDRIIKKIGAFHQNFNCYGKVFLVL